MFTCIRKLPAATAAHPITPSHGSQLQWPRQGFPRNLRPLSPDNPSHSVCVPGAMGRAYPRSELGDFGDSRMPSQMSFSRGRSEAVCDESLSRRERGRE